MRFRLITFSSLLMIFLHGFSVAIRHSVNHNTSLASDCNYVVFTLRHLERFYFFNWNCEWKLCVGVTNTLFTNVWDTEMIQKAGYELISRISPCLSRQLSMKSLLMMIAKTKNPSSWKESTNLLPALIKAWTLMTLNNIPKWNIC